VRGSGAGGLSAASLGWMVRGLMRPPRTFDRMLGLTESPRARDGSAGTP